MKICKTEQEYIDAIAPAVQKACKRYGYLPSVLIAQSCLENGYGIPSYWDNTQIEALLAHNNMVGIKSELLSSTWADKTVWPGKSLTKRTPETYNGKNVIITDNFRIYDNIEQSFADFLLFLTYASTDGKKPKYGPAVLSIKDPEQLIKAVHSRGYATGPTYATNVMRIIHKHNLTKYDDLTGVEPTKYTPGYGKDTPAQSEGIQINRKYITANNSYSDNTPVAIVIHNTDNFRAGADAKSHAEWLATDTDTGMSWHYAVDDHSIYQCLPHNRGAFHVGKNYGSNNLFSTYGGRNHRNTIAIEMCVNKGYDYEKAFQNTVKLTRHLMKELNIPAERVFQHYDICSKDCPSQIRKHGDWARFKSLIGSGAPAADTAADYITVGARGEEVRQMQRMLIACGYACGSYGADGIFGTATSAALKAFKAAAGMEHNDHYGAKTAEKLKTAYAQKTAKKEEQEVIEEQTTPRAFTRKIPASKIVLDATQLVADTGRLQGWTYGNSGALPPCDDHLCSCDRGPSRANWLMGFRDQRQGGETCGSLDSYLTSHGWAKVTDKAKIKAGAIVAVRYTKHSYIDHVFQVVSYNKKTGRCTKYDFGSTQQIQAQQPFKNVPLLAWGANRIFVCAWNPPSWLCSARPKQWVKDGFDYSLVFNATYYLAMYPDLRKAYKTNKKKAFEHFLKCGMAEGRQATAGFNPVAYKERYPDLRKAFGKDYPKYYKHYCTHGFGEGRTGF